MRLDQDGIDVKSDVNGREGMASIRCSRKAISGRFWRQGKIGLRVEVADIEGKGDYQRSRFKGGTEIIPPD